MSFYCLKCRKNTERINDNMVKQVYYQNVQYVVVNNQDLVEY